MALDLIRNSFKEASELLEKFYSDKNNLEKIKQAGDMMVAALQENGKIYTCGNGGSLTDAMHFAEELSGRFRNDRRPLPAIAITDPAHLSCVANDYGYDYVFSRFLEAFGNNGDVLLCISTSGNSTNVINAAKVAQKKQMKVVALTGKDGGQLATLCNVEIRVPWHTYSDRIQEIHIKVIHNLVHYIENMLLLEG